MSEVKNGKSWASCCATALLSGLVVLSAVPAAASTIYAIDSLGDRLYRLDPATGAATLVAPTSPPIVDPRGSGLAVEWSTGRDFVSNLSLQYFLGFEAWLGDRWYTFDARNNTPRIGRVLIARGRDAADVAMSSTFGPNTLTSFKVWTDEVPAV